MMGIKDILFWVFLVIGLILLIWTVFGNSPTEFIAMMTLIFTILLKTWSVSDRVLKLEMRFNALVKDYKSQIKK